MRVERAALDGVLLFTPTPHRDDRGLFTRTFDSVVTAGSGLDPTAFIQDSRSRSRRGTVRGTHGRSGRGEAEPARCARGAVHDVLVDVRPDSPTFGEQISALPDDETFVILHVPPGPPAPTEQTDVRYRIDREHDPDEDMSVRYDDPDLRVHWPLPVSTISDAGSRARPLFDSNAVG
ncbi:dTDP-4-dehydrorhamnose 3,5-epimerase family protein [Streptosporangium amethystogenes]|uniref:dTDP-4-dehydrorhamnose 3,5-epimerase family protein n=1 Tax=Streptosporangium amethystogenes TaxID=2002 RepID=UPI0004C89EF6|nr:dTDP-4-dehydrorhamnose 3,5-epimerase family protein [Streptosporangium amethystogenes]